MRGLLDAIWYLRSRGYSVGFSSEETGRGRLYKVSLSRPPTEGVLMMADDIITRAKKLEREEKTKERENRPNPIPFSGKRSIGFMPPKTRDSKGYFVN